MLGGGLTVLSLYQIQPDYESRFSIIWKTLHQYSSSHSEVLVCWLKEMHDRHSTNVTLLSLIQELFGLRLGRQEW